MTRDDRRLTTDDGGWKQACGRRSSSVRRRLSIG
jgi:hypothetical protein